MADCEIRGVIKQDLHNKLGKLMKERNGFIKGTRVINPPPPPHLELMTMYFNHSGRNRSYQQRNKYGANSRRTGGRRIMAKESFSADKTTRITIQIASPVDPYFPNYHNRNL